MTAFFVRRAITTMFIVAGAILFIFVLIQFIPGDPATTLLGPRATPKAIARMREKMRLDEPIYVQFGIFFYNVLQGDLGEDVLNHKPVSALVFQVLPHTLLLAFSSILLASLLGIPLGAYSAAHQGSLIDSLLGVTSVAMITVPPFLGGLFLILFFSVYLRWFPILGAETKGIVDYLWHLILPMCSLTLTWVGYIARLVRSAMLEELGQDYVKTARSKGLREWKVVNKHALRSALIPVVTVLGVGFGTLLGGAVLVEVVFHRPGIGTLIIESIKARNYPVVEGALLITVFLYALVNLLADLSLGFIDPRIRVR